MLRGVLSNDPDESCDLWHAPTEYHLSQRMDDGYQLKREGSMKLVVRYAFSFAAAGLVMSSLAAAAAPQGDPSARRPNTPAAIYGRKCASCHGKDGRADTIKGKLRSARNLTDPQWQDDVSDERIYNSIMNGRGKMPRYANKLSEADINSLVSYVRGLKK